MKVSANGFVPAEGFSAYGAGRMSGMQQFSLGLQASLFSPFGPFGPYGAMGPFGQFGPFGRGFGPGGPGGLGPQQTMAQLYGLGPSGMSQALGSNFQPGAMPPDQLVNLQQAVAAMLRLFVQMMMARQGQGQGRAPASTPSQPRSASPSAPATAPSAPAAPPAPAAPQPNAPAPADPTPASPSPANPTPANPPPATDPAAPTDPAPVTPNGPRARLGTPERIVQEATAYDGRVPQTVYDGAEVKGWQDIKDIVEKSQEGPLGADGKHHPPAGKLNDSQVRTHPRPVWTDAKGETHHVDWCGMYATRMYQKAGINCYWVPGEGIKGDVKKVYGPKPEDIKKGDVVVGPGPLWHHAVVTDIVRDKDGKVVAFKTMNGNAPGIAAGEMNASNVKAVYHPIPPANPPAEADGTGDGTGSTGTSATGTGDGNSTGADSTNSTTNSSSTPDTSSSTDSTTTANA
jgi:hypothetical protein